MGDLTRALLLFYVGCVSADVTRESLPNGFSISRTFPAVEGEAASITCVASYPIEDRVSGCTFTSPQGQLFILNLESGEVTGDGSIEDNLAAFSDETGRMCGLNIVQLNSDHLGQWECKVSSSDRYQKGRVNLLTAEEGYVKDVRLPRHVIPSLYTISLTPFFIDSANNTIDGEVDITAQLVTAENQCENKCIVMHTVDTWVKEESIAVTNLGDRMDVVGVGYDYDRNFLIIDLHTALEEGDVQIQFNFVSELRSDLSGFYRSTYTDPDNNMKTIATTQFESTDARKAFPCFDEPDMKANFTVNLGRHESMITLSNMKIRETTDMGNSYVMDHYETSVTMSTYLLAFIVCEFRSTFAPGHEEFKVWAPEDKIPYLEYAAAIGPQIVAHYEEVFGAKFPLQKMDMAAIPDFQSGAMENWGLITYRDSNLFYDNVSFSEANRLRVAVVVSHELAHQWFGNLVTMKWWNDLWLNEGFASYVEYLGTDHVAPEMNIREQVVNIDMHDVFYLDSLPSSHPISVQVDNPIYDERFDRISYGKGSVLIRMMESFLGTDTFLTGLRSYFQVHSYSNAEQDDLWKSLGETWDTDDVNVKRIMDTWTTYKGYPVVNVSVKDEFTWTVSQQKFNLEIGSSDVQADPWWIPLTFQNVLNPAGTIESVWLSETAAEVESSENIIENTFVFNVDQYGYYRVNYDSDSWAKIAENFQQLSNINRAQVIDDALNLARAGQLDYVTAFNVLLKLEGEVDYITLDAAENALTFLDLMLRHADDSEAYNGMRETVMNLLEVVYGQVADQPGANYEETHTRSLIMDWTCYLGSETCRDAAFLQFQQWKEAEDYESSVTPDDKPWVYCNGIRTGTEADWDLAWARLQETAILSERFALITALSCTSNPDLVARYLEKSIDPNSSIRNQDKRYVYIAIGRSEGRGGEMMLSWLMDNFATIKEFYADTFVYNVKNMLLGFPEEATTEEEKELLARFLEEHRAELGSAVGTGQEGLDKIAANIKWKENFYTTVSDWFTNHRTSNSS